MTAVAGAWGVSYGQAQRINNRGDVVGLGNFVDGSGRGAFVAWRGTFRFHDPYLLLFDINERGTPASRYSPDGWTAQGALLPKAQTRVPVALPRGGPTP